MQVVPGAERWGAAPPSCGGRGTVGDGIDVLFLKGVVRSWMSKEAADIGDRDVASACKSDN